MSDKKVFIDNYIKNLYNSNEGGEIMEGKKKKKQHVGGLGGISMCSNSDPKADMQTFNDMMGTSCMEDVQVPKERDLYEIEMSKSDFNDIFTYYGDDEPDMYYLHTTYGVDIYPHDYSSCIIRGKKDNLTKLMNDFHVGDYEYIDMKKV